MNNWTCGTCKHRGKDVLEEYGGTGPHFFCDRAEFYQQGEPNFPATVKFYTEDASGAYAALCVSADFGCVEWEAK